VNAADRLREVQRNGGPTQVKQATDLLAQLATQPADPDLEEEVAMLCDAYLNDPYLTRNEEGQTPRDIKGSVTHQ